MSLLGTFFFIVLISITQSLDAEERELNEWIATLEPNEINYFKKYQPWRLRTDSENIRLSDLEIENSLKKTLHGAYFSGCFTNNTVLQREPHYSSIYGSTNKANFNITLTMIDEESNSQQIFTITTMSNGDWKLLLPKTYPNGGNYTFNVSCPQCVNSSTHDWITEQIIRNVTFGDVYYCAGQSNMWLPMFHTFSRNYTYSNITKLGKYKNIRFFMKQTSTPSQPMWVYLWRNVSGSNGQYSWHQTYELDQLDKMASSCWYFGQELSDKHGIDNVTLGLVQVSVGGSIIESWIKNHTVPYYCNQTKCPGPGCGTLYNGQVAPFINMTIKAALWYQGENNVGKIPSGSWLNSTGYGCMEPLMLKQWRDNFSLIENTTDKLFHFGVVTLASQTSEGHQINMSSFRWAQSANYDILPNPVMPNTFIAQGYDIGDPWGKPCGPYCFYPAPYNNNQTHWDDGPIHPRPKLYVGQRLARGIAKFVYDIDQIWAGPLIESCEINNNLLTINFNKTMLYDEEVIVQPFAPWYNTSITANHTTSLQLFVGGNDGDWVWIDDDTVKKNTNNVYSINIDISVYTSNNTQISGIRYAWTDTPCCGDLNIKMYPCPPNSCRIVTSKTLLPASPFWAQIIDNKCKCFPPQECG